MIRAEIIEKEMKEIVKINKTKSQFFEKIKLTNLQPDSSRKKEKNQINKIRNENYRNTKDYETIVNNYMTIKKIIQRKWTESQKCSIF